MSHFASIIELQNWMSGVEDTISKNKQQSTMWFAFAQGMLLVAEMHPSGNAREGDIKSI